MKAYTFTGGRFGNTYGGFTQPVRWTEGGAQFEAFVSLAETHPANNHQFVTEAYRFNGHEGQPLLLVSAEGEVSVRADVKAVTLKPGERVKIKIQPYTNPPSG